MKPLTTSVELLRLRDILDGIDEGRFALPDFQRDFVWQDADVKSLLVTVFRRWPAGSLLLIRGEPAPFRLRPIVGGPVDIDPAKVSHVVLDGQQRLTALYQALTNRGPYVYALDVSRLMEWEDEDIEEAIVSIRRSQWDETRVAGPSPDRLLLPLYTLRSPSDYFRWVETTTEKLDDGEAEALEERLIGLHQRALGGVETYEFAAAVLDRELPVEAIARIFETVNRTGMRLGAFDLVVARSYDESWNLRDAWEQARTSSSVIDRFLKEDGMRVLQVIALRELQNVRQSAVLSLPASIVRSEWSSAVDGIDRALRFLVRHCGVVNEDWLPYATMLLPLAALAVEHDLEGHDRLLRRWFFATAFGLTFEVGANTAAVAEYERLRLSFESDAELDVPQPTASSLFEATRQRRGALWRAFMSALARNNAHDLTGMDLGLASAAESFEGASTGIVISSVVPRNPERWPELSLHRRVLSQVIAERASARRLRGGDPLWSLLSQPYLEGLAAVPLDAALASQFFPPLRVLEAIHLDPLQVLFSRLEGFAAFMDREVGVPIAWDLPEDISYS